MGTSSSFTDTSRAIQLTTPLGANALLPANFRGREAVSELFRFQIDALRENATPPDFSSILGQNVTVAIQGKSAGGVRYFNGVVIGFTQGAREELFTHYRLEVAPSLWTLTRNAQSRIFQQKTVIDILKAVFTGLTVDYSNVTGTYPQREYTVQYRETDFNFASRLMEEEGIFYFFKHENGSHALMLGDNPQAFSDIPFQTTLTFETLSGGGFNEDRVLAWEKAQDLRSGKHELRDFTFQSPDKTCMATQNGITSVQAGTVTHSLSVNQTSWELYDYPGGYAKRFDGIDKSGGEQPTELNNIFSDNSRVAGIRMQAETAGVLTILGEGLHPGFTPGYTFTLKSHFTDNGEFTLLAVDHDAHQPIGTDTEPYRYTNRFRAIPNALPYRPPRTTPVPVIYGPQTAVVVGASGEEITTDKYGRVKVQFHWDRQGSNDINSSCWLRVATHWAGTQWGAVHIPRIGQEVIVAFLEGDPDQPIIVGSVYNADNMPPYTLPDNKTQSGIKSRSSLSGGASNYNEIFFEDKMGSEILRIHAEKDQFHEVENDDTQTVGHDRTTTIEHDETREVKNNRTTTIDVDETKTVKGKETITITGNQTLEIQQGNQSITLDQGNQSTTLNMGNQSNQLDMGNHSLNCDLGSISMEAMQSITLTVGANSITIDQTGVTINGMMITVSADISISESAMMIQSSAEAMMQIQGAITMIN
jgi:type VI secretion system secreted protein VgrG